MLGLLWYFLYGWVVIGLSIYGLHRLWMVWTYFRCKSIWSSPMDHFDDDQLPKVTIQLPLYNERHVARRLIRSVAALDYPIDRMEIQILDDSTDETSEIVAAEVADLKSAGVQIEHIRRSSREGYKAGALQYGLERCGGDLVAIFDADFVPNPKLLLNTVHYFTDPEVGLIQTRWGHLNRSQSLLTRIQALLLDGHLLIEQTVRNRSGRFFNFNGTAGIWRKTCILEAGGWEHDTLTEDLDLSYRAQMAGWRFVFLGGLVTPAELPADMNAFKTQQHRWAKGAVQTCKKLLPRILKSDLPWRIKLEAVFHLTSNFAYLLLALMAFLIIPDPKGNPDLTMVLAVHVPIFMLASFSVILFYGVVLHEVGVRWWKWFAYLPLLIALGIGLSLNNAKAVVEALFNRPSEFTRTPKVGDMKQTRADNSSSFYLSPRSWLILVEALLFLHYAHYTWVAYREALWLSLPFFVLFCFGFGYTACMSLGAGWNYMDWKKQAVPSKLEAYGI